MEQPPEPPAMSQILQNVAHMSQLYAQRAGLQQGRSGRLAAVAAAQRSGIHNMLVLACTYKWPEASTGHFNWEGVYCSPDLWAVLLTYLVGLSECLYDKLGAGKKQLGNQCSSSSSRRFRKGSQALGASSLAELQLPPDHEAVVVVGGRRAVEGQVEAFKAFYEEF